MNNLKTARRSRMGIKLLRILMTICSLGAEWSDASKIKKWCIYHFFPVKCIL